MAYTDIDFPAEYFETKLYTGTGATHSISGLNFQPDLTWIKTRNSGADWHRLIDAVRGTTKELYSNATNAESIQAQSLQTFNTDGFTLGTLAEVNASGNTFVSWNWKANGAGVSNTAGTITSTVSANTTSGFSIVSYTGTGATGTVGHGLNSAPQITIIKRRNATTDWAVYTNAIDGSNDVLFLNSTSAQSATSAFSTDSDTLNFTGSSTVANTTGADAIAYCFHSVKGFSKMGSYVGNGSTDGSFIYTGFKPAFVIIKQSSASGNNWNVYDNKRDIDNVVDARLLPSTSDAETTLGALDFLSNGFKLRATGPSFNGSGSTYIYMCFAESPFTTSTGIPTTAR